MPISEIGSRRAGSLTVASSDEAGFTLVELLVVVFIIAMMSTVVVLSLPERDHPVETAARDLAVKLHQAGRESIVSGQPLALAARTDGQLRFERLSAGVWEPIDIRLLRLKYDPSGMDLEFMHDSETLRPKTESDTSRRNDSRDRYVRQVIFSPLGDATPVTLTLRSGPHDAVVTVSDTGEVQVDAQG